MSEHTRQALLTVVSRILSTPRVMTLHGVKRHQNRKHEVYVVYQDMIVGFDFQELPTELNGSVCVEDCRFVQVTRVPGCRCGEVLVQAVFPGTGCLFGLQFCLTAYIDEYSTFVVYGSLSSISRAILTVSTTRKGLRARLRTPTEEHQDISSMNSSLLSTSDYGNDTCVSLTESEFAFMLLEDKQEETTTVMVEPFVKVDTDLVITRKLLDEMKAYWREILHTTLKRVFYSRKGSRIWLEVSDESYFHRLESKLFQLGDVQWSIHLSVV
ncbi:hypothetical protein GMRT_14941 [Giardia muris]|uniref:Uncharacterized protein n=1 Tax=Giardia muris TaxID=5742 RepID=A0A4Z1T582_GIAMU|nr:hypothetical protein GMRT_14941 [Giardia muris]|eukprot:TNJ29173.1 hypothetical protein GMRT_14941 [Giardia muris]